MLMHKQAHGSGVDLDFPDANQIEEAMRGYDPEHMVPFYGDGCYTTPTKWWAALGGYGVRGPKLESKCRSHRSKGGQELFRSRDRTDRELN